MEQHYFVGDVIHSKEKFKKGQPCPEHLLEEFKAKKLVSPELPDPKLLSAQQRLDLAKKQMAAAEAEVQAEAAKVAPKAPVVEDPKAAKGK